MLITSALTFSTFYLTTSSAHAIPLEGRTQLELQTALFSAYRNKLEGDDYSTHEERYVAAGLMPRFGAAAAYAVRERLQLRLLLGFALNSLQVDVERAYATEETRGSGLQYEIMPGLRYVRPGDRVRWFLGAGMGFAGSVAEYSSHRSFTVGGALGLYGFLNDWVSLDPAIDLSWSRVRLNEQSIDGSGPDVDSKGGALRFLLTLSLSGWLGGRTAP